MSPTLSAQSSLENLRKEAKRWLRAIRSGDASALARFRAVHPQAPNEPTLRDVQHALACHYGAASWSDLKQVLAERAESNRTQAARVDDFLKNACISYDNDHSSAWREAARLLQRFPEIERDGLHPACVAGNLDIVTDTLRRRPQAVHEKAGPRRWEPLLYVCYSRLPIPAAADNAIDIARALLDAGADPNVTFRTEGGFEFSALTGAIGEGEGTRATQPAHPHARELAELLIERGADPYDPQALYNTSLDADEVFWLDFLFSRSVTRGEQAKWEAPSDRWPFSSMLDYLLGNAIGGHHLQRAAWLLEHGARATAPGYYDKGNLHTKAILAGNVQMAELLAQHGAKIEPLDERQQFHVACMNLNEARARELATKHPEYLLTPAPMIQAASHDRTDIIEMLLALGMSPNVSNKDGFTPLHAAARNDAAKAAHVLIAHGANVDLPDNSYHSPPLGWALYFDKHDAARVIATASFAVRQLGAMGNVERLRTVLIDRQQPLTREESAALFTLPEVENVAIEVATLLLAHGADRQVTNDAGLTPAEHAEQRGFDALADVLS